MSDPQTKRLKELLSKSESYLEYGCGGSTLLAAKLGVAKIYSVESDSQWSKDISQKIKSIDTISDIKINYIDIGPVDEWGTPIDSSKYKDYWRYSMSPYDDHHKDRFDLILIDGRFRLACFFSALLYTPYHSIILIDDYMKRRKYLNIMEDYVSPYRITDELAEFRVSDAMMFDTKIFTKQYLRYQHDVR